MKKLIIVSLLATVYLAGWLSHLWSARADAQAGQTDPGWGLVCAPADGGRSCIQGDLNCDAEVDISDAIYLLEHLFLGKSPPCEPAASPEDLADCRRRLNECERRSCYTVEVADMFDSPGMSQRPDGVIYNGATLWIAEVNDNTIYELNPRTGQTLGTLPVTGHTHDLAWDGENLWLTTYWDDPPVVSSYTEAGEVQKRFEMPPEMAYPTALAYDNVNGVLWAVNTNEPQNPLKFWKIDATDGAVLDSWPLVSGETPLVYGMCMDDSPDYLWFVSGNRLRKVSIAERAIVRDYTIPSPAALLTGVHKAGPLGFWLVTSNVEENHILRVVISESEH